MGTTATGANERVGERHELRISVSTGAEEHDLRVLASPADTIDKLTHRLCEHLKVRGRPSLHCERRQAELPAELTLDRAGIRWGDRLTLAGGGPREPTRLGGDPLVEVLVTGGPCTGQRFELGEGAYSVGRGHEVDVQILDPSLSRRHLDLTVERSGVSIVDPGSRNGTALKGVGLAVGETRRVRPTDEIELGRTLLRTRPIAAATAAALPVRGGRVAFNRPPRITPADEVFARELDAPPNKARKGRIPLAASAVPLLAGLILFLLLKSPVMLAVAGLSPLMAITTFVSDRRGGRKSFARQSREFRRELELALDELDGALEAEAQARRLQAPDASTLGERLTELAPSLWERRPEHSNFLRLRVGVADLPAASRVIVQKGGDAELRASAEEQFARRRRVPAVPFTIDAREVAVIGLAGPSESVDGLARWLVLQAALLHSPADLVILAALGRDRAVEWSWLKWLPHLRPQRVGLSLGPVAVGRQDGAKLLAELCELGVGRQQHAGARGGRGRRPPQVLVLIDEDLELDRSLVSAALSDAVDAGIAAVWLGSEVRDLPGEAGAILEIDERRSVVRATNAATGVVEEDVSGEALSRSIAGQMARALSPLRDVAELARGGDIPRRAGLLELLDLLPPSAEAIERRWLEWDGQLEALVGVGADGPVTLDLREEGPHALIAGTTGSGKSELLRTIVAAAAAAAPPHRLTFLLVDYKGGAAFAPCDPLPHVLDTISDLDEHMAERALVSLDAELTRRSRILAERGTKDLLELAARDPDAAPPLLVIAVDEFAKLREEVPRFVDGVVDIAQRGRSMGVHMVLAAQTLRNSFTAAMRLNTNLRVALRVAEESESEDVIASPLAARIPSGRDYRGRAFVRTGKTELREFQTAYVSGLSDAGESEELEVKPFDLYVLQDVAEPDTPGIDSDADSDLVRLAQAAVQAQRRLQLPTPSPPWLPMLSQRIELDALVRPRRRGRRRHRGTPRPAPPAAPGPARARLPPTRQRRGLRRRQQRQDKRAPDDRGHTQPFERERRHRDLRDRRRRRSASRARGRPGVRGGGGGRGRGARPAASRPARAPRRRARGAFGLPGSHVPADRRHRVLLPALQPSRDRTALRPAAADRSRRPAGRRARDGHRDPARGAAGCPRRPLRPAARAAHDH